MSLADGARRTLVERFATNELRENYGLRLFPPVIVGLMLSLDELNPVKIFCAYTGVEVEVVFVALVGALLVLTVLERLAVAYYATRSFLLTIQTVFFKSVDVVGIGNIPLEGPVIFVGNHSNQFADGIMLIMNARRKVGFLIAQKSWDLPVIGWMARALGCVPLKRAADLVRPGVGAVRVHGDVALGEGTRFTAELRPNDSIIVGQEQPRTPSRRRARSQPEVKRRVLAVLSDTELRLRPPDAPPATDAAAAAAAAAPLSEAERAAAAAAAASSSSADGAASAFRIASKPDHSAMFGTVLQRLERGACIGLFPEGGSHDRPDLLPLKHGVAEIALQFSARAKDGRGVPIVPCGLTYFRGHEFRARAVLEFGAPTYVTEEQVAQHATAPREAVDGLMREVEARLRSVLVTAPDYETLQLIHVARRLYTPDGANLSADQKGDLNRRFAEASRKLFFETAQPPAELVELRDALRSYARRLHALGVADHQVPQLQFWAWRYLLGSLLMTIPPWLIAVVPGLMLNAPIGALAHLLALRHQRVALRASNVKLQARDVVLSRKILVSIVGVPSLWLSYGALLHAYSGWQRTSVILVVLAFPMASYVGVRATEAGMAAWADLRPLLMRLLRGGRTRREMSALPAQRVALRQQLRRMAKKHGPALGDMYYAPRFDPLAHSDSRSDLATLAAPASAPASGAAKKED